MPTTQTHRKWTATVAIDGEDVSPLLELPWDTLREVERAARDLAVALLRDGYGSEASVVIFKQLKNDAEPVRDRSHAAYRDGDRIHTMFTGA